MIIFEAHHAAFNNFCRRQSGDVFDQLVARKGHLNHSGAFRDLAHKELGETEITVGKAKWCVATVTYICDQHEPQLADRLTQLQHDHYDLATTQHIYLGHGNCLETVVLRDGITNVRACADAIVSQTGVRPPIFIWCRSISNPANMCRAYDCPPASLRLAIS